MFSKFGGFFRCPSKYAYYSEKIAIFVHTHPELYLSKKELYKVYRLYVKWSKSAKFLSLPLERELLHYIAERAFWSEFDDADFVADLLRYMHRIETHFGYFLCPRHEHYPRNVRLQNRARFAEYFMKCANEKCFAVGGRRVPDTIVNYRSTLQHPCEIAIGSNCPELLHVLLRYGALTTEEELTLYSVICMGNILKTLFYVIRMILDMRQAYSWKSGMRFDDPSFSHLIQCGKLIVRACPQLEKRLMFEKNNCKFAGFTNVREAITWATCNVLPELEYRVFLPLKLKHACRLKIRKTLYDSWQLPNGIKSLPIPEVLKMYLNLYSD